MCVDPNTAPSGGAQLHQINVRLTQREVEACLKRLMGFSRPDDECLPLITALAQIQFRDRLVTRSPYRMSENEILSLRSAASRVWQLLNDRQPSVSIPVGSPDQACSTAEQPSSPEPPASPAEVGDDAEEKEEAFEEWLSRVPEEKASPSATVVGGDDGTDLKTATEEPATQPEGNPQASGSTNPASPAAESTPADNVWRVRHLHKAVRRFGTQKKLADACGVAQPYISKLCRLPSEQNLSNEKIQAWLSTQEWLTQETLNQQPGPDRKAPVTRAMLPVRLSLVLNNRKATTSLEKEFIDAFIQSGMGVESFIKSLRQVGGMVALS